MNDIATKLDEARALIERGWTQGVYERTVFGRRCYCALGAIGEACRGDPADGWLDGVGADALRALGSVTGKSDTADWNDAQKSKKPVIEAFRQAAKLAERRTKTNER